MFRICDSRIFVVVFLSMASVTAQAVDLSRDAQDRLRSRLVVDESAINLWPALGESFDWNIGPSFDPQLFMNGIEAVAGIEGVWEAGETERSWRAETPFHTIKVIKEKMLFVVRDQRPYYLDPIPESMPEDSVLLEQARTLLEAIGARPDEMETHHIAFRARRSKPHKNLSSAPPSAPEKMSKKVYFDRSIGGIPIKGDKIVFTFSLDGRFRKMIGKWRRIDYGASTMSSSLSEEQFLSVSVEQLLVAGVDPDDAFPIYLGTTYVPYEISPGVFAVDLKGVARIGIYGPNGERRWHMHYYDI